MKQYVTDLKYALDNLNLDRIQEAIDLFEWSYQVNGVIYICGNGGSASTASHLVCDLVKNVPRAFRAFSLSDNAPTLTAYANDEGFETVFVRRLGEMGASFKSILFAISTSGNSENIIQAARESKQLNMPVIALTGRDGGELGKMADIEIRVPSNQIQIIEDVHLTICHMIAVGLGA